MINLFYSELSRQGCNADNSNIFNRLGLVVPLFNKDPEVVAIATTYLKIVPISYGAAGIIQVTNSGFNALGKPIPAVIITVLRMFVLYIPLAYLGSLWLGATGIFIAATVSNVIVGIDAYCWTRRACVGKTDLIEV